MTLAKLIERLQQIQKQVGGKVPVICCDCYDNWFTVSELKVLEGDYKEVVICE